MFGASHTAGDVWMTLDAFFRSSVNVLNVDGGSRENVGTFVEGGKPDDRTKVGLQGNTVPVRVVRDDALARGTIDTYLDKCVANTIICEASSGIATEFIEFTTDAFERVYKKETVNVQRKLLELSDSIVKSILVRGFCVLLRQESDPDDLKRPVKSDADARKQSTHTSHDGDDDVEDSGSDSGSGSEEEEHAAEAPKQAEYKTCKINDSVTAVLIDNNKSPICADFDNNDPTYALNPSLAEYIYVSRLSKCYAIDTEGIFRKFGICDAHKRVCVVGFEGVQSSPRCIPIFPQVLLLHVLTQSNRVRMGLNTVPIVCAKLQSHEQLSLLFGPNREIVDSLYDMTEGGIQQLNTTFASLSQNMLEQRLSSYGNASAAPFRTITIPPGWEGSPIAQQTLDPLTTAIMDKAIASIAAHLGVSGGGGPMRFREQSFYTIGRLQAQFSTRTAILIKFMPVICALFGVELTEEDYDQLTVESRITKLTSMVVRAAVGDKIVDASKGVDIDQIAADTQEPDSSVSKRPRTHEYENDEDEGQAAQSPEAARAASRK